MHHEWTAKGAEPEMNKNRYPGKSGLILEGWQDFATPTSWP
ncbi:predicted protein [Chaetomium globosum CBS 148.51]|uniref:Uncharacterized protein n=1 Tax=Chaetomium globosum (strain ATCC 6205 / CBS 148.51 / DSM 1962 / NBRC 6347 / NRRL 1970) TaxID=306901 RepID=Q2HGM8_CHAGB|nr:uncharacterized protein CHGG_00626 [Chaetomium globosum CBS 148.51]EAQ92391.1 predicted protein [Chaetomium globosum CBS 148.51]